jgi:hypothetical protein
MFSQDRTVVVEARLRLRQGSGGAVLALVLAAARNTLVAVQSLQQSWDSHQRSEECL